MTDFLEELLNQQEEEEIQTLLQSNVRPAQTALLSRGSSKDESTHVGHADAQTAAVPETAVLTRQQPGVGPRVRAATLHTLQTNPAAAYAGGVTGSVSGQNPSPVHTHPLLDKVRLTYSAARFWPIRTNRTNRNIPGAAGHTGESFYRLNRQEHVIPGYAALVDAAFARDARRYDGPLRIL